MHLLYPNSPLQSKQPDEQYAAEVEAVRSTGFEISIFSLEDFQSGTFRTRPPLPNSANILYRGWMLSGTEYESLGSAVVNSGAKLLIDQRAYLASHHLPNWYTALADLTPETRTYALDCDLEAELRLLDWPEYFIKDYVKSLKTSVGSRISSPEQAKTVAAEMRRFRGAIEGGFCIRRVEDFIPNSEQRYFVIDGVPHSASGEVPLIVRECAKRLPNRFYSVDITQREDGKLRIVEVGDGQVSDLVGWTPEQFASILKEHFL